MLAQVAARIADHLPSERGPWRFQGEHTSILPLLGPAGQVGSIECFDRLPHPRIGWNAGAVDAKRPGTGPITPFQRLLAARVQGPLLSIDQPGLDRALHLRFGPTTGFVDLPPVTLVVEVTGRHGNTIVVDEDGRIVAAARWVDASVNRYRQVRPGLPYLPPPPYAKLDPRSSTRARLAEALAGHPLARIAQRVDGVGPTLTKAISMLAKVDLRTVLEGQALDACLDALERVVAAPDEAVAATSGQVDIATLRRQERRDADLKLVRQAWTARKSTAQRRLADVDRARTAADAAARMRYEADLLLAHGRTLAAGSARATLTGWEGEEVTIDLDPRRDAAGNADDRYRRAKSRESRAERAEALHARWKAAFDEADATLAALDGWSDSALRDEAQRWRTSREKEAADLPGMAFDAPHGFEVRVGRSARDNDALTFKFAKSRDVWLHVQGWHGSHVVVVARNREVPFDVIVHAARLAAGYSKAVGGDNVPVDYTLRKHVWRVKGAPAGAVHYAHQKTVYVTPLRSSGSDRSVVGDDPI